MKSTPHFDSIGNDNMLNITSAQYRTVNRFRNPFSALSQKVEFSCCTLDFLIFFLGYRKRKFLKAVQQQPPNQCDINLSIYLPIYLN